MAAICTDGEEPTISGMRILVVDDELEARELVTATLTSRGAVIQQASSAAEALDSLSREKPDLMISDIGMPREDGYVLIRKLRAVEREHAQPKLPVIALTAYASAGDRNLAQAAGFDLYLVKPVAPVDLICAIDKVSRAKDFRTDSPLTVKPKKSA
jgi:CheY-like chemotaxis protein